MIVNGLTKAEVKHVRRVMKNAYMRLIDAYAVHRTLSHGFQNCSMAEVLKARELSEWYSHGITEMTRMLEFGDKAIAAAKR